MTKIICDTDPPFKNYIYAIGTSMKDTDKEKLVIQIFSL